MTRALRSLLLVGALALSGCPAPWIRTPDLFVRNPEAERASFTQNDPLPDNSLGPNPGGFRPREANTQRSEPRRTIEASIPGSNPQMMAPPMSSYPNTISP